jgi:hypothetical protein
VNVAIKRGLALGSAVLLCGWLAGATLFGQSVGNQPGYVKADAAGCQVWAPSMLRGDDHVPHYTGSCKGGYAEGQGKVEWRTRSGSSPVVATWAGSFHSGVFTGDRTTSFPVTPGDGDRYAVVLGHLPGGDVTEIATSPQTGGMDLCRPEALAIKLDAAFEPTDDEAMKHVMSGAVAKLQGLCPQAASRVQVTAFSGDPQWNGSNFKGVVMAEAMVTMGTKDLLNYQNKAANAARQKTRQDGFEAKRAAGHRAFDAFSMKNGVVAWVTTEQLDQNPFKYEGKVVGVFVTLERMVTRDTALIDSGLEEGYGDVQLRGVTPDFPDKRTTVMLAVRVGKREPIPGGDMGSAAFTAVTRVDSFACAERGCDDVLRWQVGGRKVHWGDPYVPVP